jgi:hypothetical protein
MVRLLLRNPLLRLLLHLWWLPVLAAWFLVIILGLWAPWSLPHPEGALATYGVLLAGIVGMACLHAADPVLRERIRHDCAGHRFLCPHCLHFGEFCFACGACGREVDALTVHTQGASISDCPQCGAGLFSRDGKVGERVSAGCRHCSAVCKREIYHERQVRVVGALRESDFTAFCSAIGVRPAHTRAGIDVGYHDDGVRLTVVLCLSDLPGNAEALRLTHAFWAIQGLWIDGKNAEPLRLGEAVDRFLQRAGLPTVLQKALTICVGGDAPDAARRLLAARFGRVACRVAPADLIGAEAPRVPARAERACRGGS